MTSSWLNLFILAFFLAVSSCSNRLESLQAECRQNHYTADSLTRVNKTLSREISLSQPVVDSLQDELNVLTRFNTRIKEINDMKTIYLRKLVNTQSQ